MTVLTEGPGELKLQELVAAIEDAIDGANLLALPERTLLDLEMRLAGVCHVLGNERLTLIDPERESRIGSEFGDGGLR